MFSFFPFAIMLVYLLILGLIAYVIFRWVNKFISLKQEQNQILREILEKMK